MILKKLEIQNVVSFNPNACKFIEDFGKKNGYNFQHGMNGGEKVICGYKLDGYDKDKNIIFEYDEPRHEIRKNKFKDIERQHRLLLFTKGRILRYSEKYNKIYEVGLNKSLLTPDINLSNSPLVAI